MADTSPAHSNETDDERRRRESEEDEKVKVTSPEAWRWLFALAWPQRGRLAIAMTSLIVSSSVSLAVPYVAGNVVQDTLHRNLDDLRGVVAGLIGLFLMNGFFEFIETYTLRTASARMLQELRSRLHAHMLALSAAFFEKQRTGDLLSRLGNDADSIGTVLSDEIVGGVNRLLVLVGVLVILFATHARLTLVMLVAVPPVMIAAVLFGRRIEKISKARQDETGAAGVIAEESLGGVRTVQAFNREGVEAGRYGAKLESVNALAVRAAFAWGTFTGVVQFLAFTAIALVIWYGATLVIRGELTEGRLISCILYTFTVAGSVGALTGLYGRLKSALGATQRVREIIEMRPEVADPAVPLEPPAEIRPSTPAARASHAHGERRVAPEIELAGVSFKYATQERRALEDVSLRAPPGEVTALVGPSGAGKSTVISLLLRYYDVAAGEVRVAGADVRKLRVADLRAAIGLVPQDIFLFGGSVAENIRYGRIDASDDDVRRAAEAAQAHRFIDRLPKGYATEVGERGVRLSTGERQRIAIARVFLKDPPILVLDEATSALDAESEHLVQEALERLMAGRTTIVIAHRLATVRRAGQVVLLEDGRATDRGPHEELFAKSAKYRRLCELQLIGAGDGAAAPEGGAAPVGA